MIGIIQMSTCIWVIIYILLSFIALSKTEFELYVYGLISMIVGIIIPRDMNNTVYILLCLLSPIIGLSILYIINWLLFF